jgi:hypothetical protein
VLEETGAVRGVVLLLTRSCLCTPDGAGVARPLGIDNIAVNETKCSAARRLAERLWLAVRQRGDVGPFPEACAIQTALA